MFQTFNISILFGVCVCMCQFLPNFVEPSDMTDKKRPGPTNNPECRTPVPYRAEYRPLKPHRDISRYGKCISQCVLNVSYKQESQFSISYRSQNLLH